MMRNKTSSSLQKTYDECYLICSTAVYFEGQVRLRELHHFLLQEEDGMIKRGLVVNGR